MNWILMVSSLPTENATIRMRAWRALKACGAAVLRDGAYLLPQLGECRSTLDAIGADVRAGGGPAYVLSTDEPDSVQFRSDERSVGQSVSVRVDLGGRRIIKKKKQ